MGTPTCDAAGPAAPCCCGPTRRHLLGALAGTVLAGAASAGGRPAAAQPAAPHRVDVHHHLTPPAYLAALAGTGAPVSPPAVGWSLAKSLDDMDRAGVATAMLSVTTPGLWLDGPPAATLARACNEYAAGLVRDHPGRFGSFAALPLPDIEASLRETAYALDVLGADGVLLFTSYAGKWLGDPHFAPLLDELNRRGAVVATHPTSDGCCRNLLPGIPDTVVEYGTDTTRTIASLVFAGAATRWPALRFVFSHAGGTMPFLIERFEFLARSPAVAARLPPGGPRAALGRFHYDTAQAANPVAMRALTAVVPPAQLLFGTDFPYRTSAEHVRGLDACGFDAAALRGIERDNALAMLPRLRG